MWIDHRGKLKWPRLTSKPDDAEVGVGVVDEWKFKMEWKLALLFVKEV